MARLARAGHREEGELCPWAGGGRRAPWGHGARSALEGLCVATGEVTLAEPGGPCGALHGHLAVKGARVAVGPPLSRHIPGARAGIGRSRCHPRAQRGGHRRDPSGALRAGTGGTGLLAGEAHGIPCECAEEPSQHLPSVSKEWMPVEAAALSSPSPGLQLEPALALPSALCQLCTANTRGWCPGRSGAVPRSTPFPWHCAFPASPAFTGN